jgi:hypothetical protein
MGMDATIMVSFGEGDSSALVVVELDDTKNLDDEGKVKTSFVKEDEIYFYVHMQPGLSIKKITKTDGSISSQGSVTIDKTERIMFEDLNKEVELGYFPNNDLSWEWYGNNGSISRNKRTLTNNFNGPCIGDVSFSFSASSFKLIPPNITLEEGETYPVLIVIHIEGD